VNRQVRGNEAIVVIPEVEALPELPPPMEIFELTACEEIIMHIVGYDLGKTVIVPRWPGAPPRKTVACLRVHMHPDFKPVYPRYWDFTPKRLVYALLPLLRAREHERNYIAVHRTVPGPAAHYSIRLIPFEMIAREKAIEKAPKRGLPPI